MKAFALLLVVCLPLFAADQEKEHYLIRYDDETLSGEELVDLLYFFDAYLERHLADQTIVVELEPWRAEELSLDPNILFLQPFAVGSADADTACTRVWGNKRVTVCTNNCLCERTDPHGRYQIQWCDNAGACPAGWTPVNITTNNKCTLAGLMADKPNCPSHCDEGIAQKHTNNETQTCCDVRWYRDCTDKDSDEEPVEVLER